MGRRQQQGIAATGTDMKYPMMKCGHIAYGKDAGGNLVCVSCLGIVPGARCVEDHLPDLTGRKAKCKYGNHGLAESSFDLPFFEYCGNCEFDMYYCGCYGWD